MSSAPSQSDAPPAAALALPLRIKARSRFTRQAIAASQYVRLFVLVAVLSSCTNDSPTDPLSGRATPQFGAFPGANGKIVFSSDRFPDGGILIMDLGGFNVQTLQPDGAEAAWSPDGSRIVFGSNIDGNSEIYVMNGDGSGRIRITNNSAFDGYATWSPDGSQIAFTSDRDFGNRIYVMDADGNNVISLTGVNNFGPSWSPDGTRIAFTSSRDAGNLEIYVMNADGTNQTRLTNDAERDFDPSWSPDGSKIVFTHGGEVGSDIYVMNADGAGPANLTNTPGSAEVSAAWSPDGSRILFVSDRDGNSEIYVMWADGTGVHQNISNNPAADYLPDWQPLPDAPPDVTVELQHLADQVALLPLPKGPKNSLLVILTDVRAALDANNTAGACSALADFISRVGAQSGKKISASEAADLIAQATAIADELGCVPGAKCYPDLPAPQLVLESTTELGNGNVEFQLDVPNFGSFPDDLFEPAPDLAACGLNTSASRTWVDILDGDGNYLFGFCSLGQASDLNNIWFATPVAQWPAEAYVTLTDRRCNITYTSNRINLAQFF
jgi:TolB protein